MILTVHQPLEQPDRTISSVACEPLGLEIEAAPDPLHHRLGDSDLHRAIGAGALGVEMIPALLSIR